MKNNILLFQTKGNYNNMFLLRIKNSKAFVTKYKQFK